MERRRVIVQLWNGPRTVRRLRFRLDEQAAHVAAMSDAAVTANLQRLGVVLAPEEDARARLAGWPAQSDLDTIEDAHMAVNGGVRPVARCLEVAP